MHRGQLILCIFTDEEQARLVLAGLRAEGVEAFFRYDMWRGQNRPLVGYHARDAAQALWMEQVCEALDVSGEILRDDSSPDDRLVLLVPACDNTLAHLLKNLLRAGQVDACVTPDVGLLSNASLYVRAADEVTAVRLLQEHQQAGAGFENDEENERMDFDEDVVVIPWPACPRCEKPRETMCPKCKTIGNDMPRADGDPEQLAELPEESDRPATFPDTALRLLCPLCDWLFAPEFYRRCAWCGHDFGEGLETDPVPQRSDPQWPNSRVMAVAFILAALLLVLLMWFAFVTP